MYPRTRNALIAWTVIFFIFSVFLLYWGTQYKKPPNALAWIYISFFVIYGGTTLPVGFHATFKGIGKVLSFLCPRKPIPENTVRVEVKVEYRHPDEDRMKSVIFLLIVFFIFWIAGILGPILFPYYVYLFKKSFAEESRMGFTK